MGNDVALLKEMVTPTLNDPRPKVSTRRPSLGAEPLVPIFSQLQGMKGRGDQIKTQLFCPPPLAPSPIEGGGDSREIPNIFV